MQQIQIDVKITSVYSRQAYAESVKEQIQHDAVICYDDRGFNGGGDAWYNAKKTYLSCDNRSSHLLCLQDDIKLCNNFWNIVNYCVTFMPNAIWSFFVGWKAEQKIMLMDNSDTPFVRVRGCKTSGQALIVPKDYIKSIVSETEQVLGDEKLYKNQDSRIALWCGNNEVALMTTNPMLVDHIQIDTTIPHHTSKKRYSRTFIKDVSHLDFKSNRYQDTPLIMPYLWSNTPKAIMYFNSAKEKEKKRIKCR